MSDDTFETMMAYDHFEAEIDPNGGNIPAMTRVARKFILNDVKMLDMHSVAMLYRISPPSTRRTIPLPLPTAVALLFQQGSRKEANMQATLAKRRLRQHFSRTW